MIRVWSGKGEVCIDQKIPHCHNYRGDQFGEIEIDLEFPVHQPDDRTVDPETDKGNDEKPGEFLEHFRIMTFKSPYPVEDIICCGCSSKPDCISEIFLDLQNLLKEVSDAEIYKNPGKTDNTKLDELQEEYLGEELVKVHRSIIIVSAKLHFSLRGSLPH